MRAMVQNILNDSQFIMVINNLVLWHLIIHFPASSGMSKGASKERASSAELTVQANEQMDKRFLGILNQLPWGEDGWVLEGWKKRMDGKIYKMSGLMGFTEKCEGSNGGVCTSLRALVRPSVHPFLLQVYMVFKWVFPNRRGLIHRLQR